MEVTVENRSNLRRRVEVRVPAQEVEKRVSTRVSELANDARIPGFRKGKVPSSLINQRYGTALHDEVYRALIDETIYTSLQEQQIEPVALFDLEFDKPSDGQDMVYKVSAEVLGDLNFDDLSELKVEKPVFEVTDEMVDTIVRNYQLQHTDWTETEGPPEKGNRVSLFVQNAEAADEEVEDPPAAEEDEEFSEAETDEEAQEYPNAHLIIGDSKTWQDKHIESHLVGMSVQESKEVHIEEPQEQDTPETDSTDESEGERSRLDVKFKILKIESGTPPAIEEIVKLDDVPGENEDELREHIKTTQTSALEVQSKAICQKQLERLLVEHSGIVLPKYSYDTEILTLRRTLQRMQMHENLTENYEEIQERVDAMPEDQLPEPDQERVESIKMSMATSFIGAKLVENYDVKVESSELEAAVQQRLASYGPNLTKEVVEQAYDVQNLRSIDANLKLQKAWEAALDDVMVEERTCSVDDLDDLRTESATLDFDIPVDHVVEESAEVEEEKSKGLLRSILDRFKKK